MGGGKLISFLKTKPGWNQLALFLIVWGISPLYQHFFFFTLFCQVNDIFLLKIFITSDRGKETCFCSLLSLKENKNTFS